MPLTRSTLEHLRFPFSYFLLPPFVFALSQIESRPLDRVLLLFAVLHLAVYPASNGFNSYYDRDEGPIGGVENPRAVTGDLLWASLALDALGLLGAAWMGSIPFVAILLYGLASKAYSHPAIRLKSRPIVGALVVAVFQGAVVYLTTVAAVAGASPSELMTAEHLLPAGLSSLLLAAGYPLTQIYQHDEDDQRGDLTLSRLLGLRGTFVFSGAVALITLPGFYLHFAADPAGFAIVCAGLAPAGLYVGLWGRAVFRDPAAAGFRRTMRLNLLSSTALIVTFAALALR